MGRTLVVFQLIKGGGGLMVLPFFDSIDPLKEELCVKIQGNIQILNLRY